MRRNLTPTRLAAPLSAAIPLVLALVLAHLVAPAALGAQIASFGGPAGPEERARVEIYDELQAEPRETPISRVAQAVGPSVVYVETEMVQPVRTLFGVQNRSRNGSGSGVVIHPSGFIITNYHVVENARNIQVSFEGNPESYSARLMSWVREEDLALLKIEATVDPRAARPLRPSGRRRGAGAGNGRAGAPDARSLRQAGDAKMAFPTVRMGTSSDLMPGERVVAIGSPHGQTYTVSTGIISGLHRDVAVRDRGLNFRGLIQTDASINFGNSGGPLLNIHGELIGINTVMNAAAENIGFAIPVDRVQQVLKDVLFPNARKTWLGFDIDEDVEGLVVSKVWPLGPAENSGICEGDRIVGLSGTAVGDREAYLLQSLQVKVGEPTTVQFSRGPERLEARVAGWDELNGYIYREIGLTVDEVRVGKRSQPLLKVDAVLPGSAAAELGVESGDLLQAVRPRTRPASRAIALWDKATLQTLLDRLPEGTEIEVDAYRDMDGDLFYSNNELLKGVLVR